MGVLSFMRDKNRTKLSFIKDINTFTLYMDLFFIAFTLVLANSLGHRR